MLSEYVRKKYQFSTRYSSSGESAIDIESIANYLIREATEMIERERHRKDAYLVKSYSKDCWSTVAHSKSSVYVSVRVEES